MRILKYVPKYDSHNIMHEFTFSSYYKGASTDRHFVLALTFRIIKLVAGGRFIQWQHHEENASLVTSLFQLFCFNSTSNISNVNWSLVVTVSSFFMLKANWYRYWVIFLHTSYEYMERGYFTRIHYFYRENKTYPGRQKE